MMAASSSLSNNDNGNGGRGLKVKAREIKWFKEWIYFLFFVFTKVAQKKWKNMARHRQKIPTIYLAVASYFRQLTSLPELFVQKECLPVSHLPCLYI